MIIPDDKKLVSLFQQMFQAVGVGEVDALTVSQHLVTAEKMGLSSHGAQRVVQYIGDVREGRIKPGTETKVNQLTSTTALLDGQGNFGQVAARRAVEVAAELAGRSGMGCVILRGCRHVGRLGAWTEMLAEKGCIGMALAAGGKEGQRVAPFGGRDPRLISSPIAFAAPNKNGQPISMDFTTSASAEGKIRFMRDSGQTLPEPQILDKDGKPSCNPGDLYAPDGSCAGAILPFGGSQGYKSYSLSLMAQILAGLLGAPVWRQDDERRFINGMWLLAIKVDSFMGQQDFLEEVGLLSDHVHSSRPMESSGEVMLPGEREFRRVRNCEENGVPVEDKIWQNIATLAESLGVAVADVCE